MDTKHAIKIFEDKKVRSVWDAEAEKWYISIVDVVRKCGCNSLLA